MASGANEAFDGVVIGAKHDGLTGAGYQARAEIAKFSAGGAEA